MNIEVIVSVKIMVSITDGLQWSQHGLATIL